ncbi:hypothetical protein [Streptomyces sp. ODS28]|uniref:hypothetical protein n=1 Tax=Streptomyces sp. ODS28 TaxID=3136688 RepID=UPI0031EFCAA6
MASPRLQERGDRAGHGLAVLLDIDEVVAPARRKIAAVLERYSPEQVELLFDYFAHAASAFREATEELQAPSDRRRAR